MKLFKRFILIIAYFSILSYAYSANMLVSGAGTATTNGVYTNMGAHATLSDGVDYYQMGPIYLYRVESGGEKMWIIGQALGDSAPGDAYYAAYNTSSSPAGITMDHYGALGEFPMPDIHIINPETNMIVGDAGTEAVEGLYVNMGIHPTLSDGVNYYQMGLIYLYRAESGGDKMWIIGTVLGDNNNISAYYGAYSPSNFPAGITMQLLGVLGEAPCQPSMTLPCPLNSAHFPREPFRTASSSNGSQNRRSIMLDISSNALWGRIFDPPGVGMKLIGKPSPLFKPIRIYRARATPHPKPNTNM
ncbi:hypothetical protein HQ585_12650 [candidate division KSB1 bacterium]|nr:hypothetical protein [candidate division KSB1 bacterium]